MEKAAEKMQERAARLDGGAELPCGAIVRIAIDAVDRAKLDNNSAVCVVVAHEKKSYRLANSAGVYKELVSRAHLQYVPDATPELMGLADILRRWKDAPSIGIRKIAGACSHAGGQGYLRCSCAGDCLNGRCKCRRLGFICNSRCHPKSSKCANCD